MEKVAVGCPFRAENNGLRQKNVTLAVSIAHKNAVGNNFKREESPRIILISKIILFRKHAFNSTGGTACH